MAQRAAARARQDAAPHRRGAAQACARAGDDRCRRLRQSGTRDGERRDDRRRADRVLRRPRHRDEGQLDPDGAERGQFLGARAARGHRAHHPVQSPVHVLRRKVRRADRGGQYGGGEAARAVAALLAAACRADRRHPAARRVQRRARRQGSRRRARRPPRRRDGRADRQRADRARRDARGLRHREAGDARARRQERADRLSGRRRGRGRGRGDRRHELHLVRAILRLDQPRLHPREDLRRGARAREGEDRATSSPAFRPTRRPPWARSSRRCSSTA